MEQHESYDRKLTYLQTFIKDCFYHLLGLGLVGVGFLGWGFYSGFTEAHLTMSVTFLSFYAAVLFLVFIGTVIKVRHAQGFSSQWSRKLAKWLLKPEDSSKS